MARKKSKQQGVAQKELAPGTQNAAKSSVSPGDAAGGGGGDAGLDRLANTRANQVAKCKPMVFFPHRLEEAPTHILAHFYPIQVSSIQLLFCLITR